MRLTEGSNINGFKVLTENDIYYNYYISPKKQDGKSYASLFSVDLNKLVSLGHGTVLIKFKVNNFMLNDNRFINADVLIKVRLSDGTFTHTMEVSNNSIYDLTGIITAKITTDNVLVAYAKIDTASDYVVCEYKYINYYTDSMKFGDITEFIKPKSVTLLENRIGGDDITVVYNRAKSENIFRLATNKNLTSSATVLSSSDFSSFLGSDKTLATSIINNNVYEIEFVSTFSGNVTDKNCYIVIQVNNSTVFVNKFEINCTESQNSSVVTKLFRSLNANDIVSIKIVNSQANGLVITNGSFLKIKEY